MPREPVQPATSDFYSCASDAARSTRPHTNYPPHPASIRQPSLESPRPARMRERRPALARTPRYTPHPHQPRVAGSSPTAQTPLQHSPANHQHARRTPESRATAAHHTHTSPASSRRPTAQTPPQHPPANHQYARRTPESHVTATHRAHTSPASSRQRFRKLAERDVGAERRSSIWIGV
jgi:hypothetical protein